MTPKQLTPLYTTFLAVAFFCAFTSAASAAALPDFTELAEKAGPAVVNINTERTAQNGTEDFFGGMFRNMPPGFEKFFEQFDNPRFRQPQQRRQKSLGSGFIISADGYIVTNNHVVEGADKIRVSLEGANGHNTLEATLVGFDEETDIALLKVKSDKPLPFLRFGDSDKARVGEWMLAIGNPFGLDHSVTAGILSAKGRNIHAGPFDNFLQTDASINPGNSGGPLLDMNGDVIGINTAIIASGQGIGFAIPSSMASRIVEQIKSGKKISRGWIGVTIQNVDETTAKALGLPSEKGALVGSVMPGEPADKAGVEAGDVVIAVDGKDVEDSNALLRAIADKKPGSETRLTLWREGASRTVTVHLGERSTEQLTAQRGGPARPGKNQTLRIGVSVRPLTADEARGYGMGRAQGLLITAVENNTPAADADLRKGDIIIAANRKPVATAAALSQILKNEGAKRGAVLLQLQRNGENFLRSVVVK